MIEILKGEIKLVVFRKIILKVEIKTIREIFLSRVGQKNANSGNKSHCFLAYPFLKK